MQSEIYAEICNSKYAEICRNMQKYELSPRIDLKKILRKYLQNIAKNMHTNAKYLIMKFYMQNMARGRSG